jgi:hypothetical protein
MNCDAFSTWRVWRPLLLSAILVCLTLSTLSAAKKISEATEENCEVCVKFVGKFIESLDEATKSSPAKVEAAFKKMCKSSKKDDNRFCYYVGGLDESATGMLGELSKPVSWSMPADKVCMKLYRQDEQICDLRYEKVLDLSTVDVKKLKVHELKKLLSDWGEQCRGCSEKNDYVKLVEELLPKYAGGGGGTGSPPKADL